ncbi:MAG: hypothetical protein N2110_01745 [Flavobacteriales bacterium]|nr:hypothetical protein [Flavobacteriales bacterium]MCX7767731.1 hypothetical protein [Flavobacteriales bacterium]MDW8409374.1 hypothetical protein [Flavobacteriales bacterium]
MKHPVLRAILFFHFLPCHSQINLADSSAQAVAYWNNGDKRIYTIRFEKVKIKDQDTLSLKVLEYDAEISVLKSKPAFYLIQWTYRYRNNPFTDLMTETFQTLPHDSRIIYKTNEMGEFSKLVNWREIRSKVKRQIHNFSKLIFKMPELNMFFQQLNTAFASRKAIEIALIKDIRQFHSFHGYYFKLGKNYIATTQIPNIFGGGFLNAENKTLLKEVDAKKGTFTIHLTQEIDKEQLTEVIHKFIRNMAEKIHHEPPKSGEIPQYNIEIQVETQLDNAGWVIESMHTQTVFYNENRNVEKRLIKAHQN